MLSYRINFENYKENFSVPAIILENNLKDVNGDYLKLILLIIKNSDKEYGINLLSKLLDLPETTVKQAISFWISKGVLKDIENNNIGRTITPNIVTGETIKPQNNVMVDSQMKFLFDSAQRMLSRVMTSTDIQILKHIYQDYNLPIDVILMVIGYCVKQGKTGIKIIENECLTWYNMGVTNSARAEEYMLHKEKQSVFEQQVREIFNMGDLSFKANEQKFIDKWYNKFRYGKDIVALAYEKAKTYVVRPTIPYVNTILANWNQKSFRTLDDILDSENFGYKNKINESKDISNKSHSFDLDEYERQLRQTPTLD